MSQPSNVTLEKDDKEIFFRVKNKSTSSTHKRKKRHVHEEMHNNDKNILKFKDKEFQKARDIIMNHDVLCNSESKNEICKDLVMKLKTITEEENHHGTEKSNESSSSAIRSGKNNDKKGHEIGITPIDMSKRETDSLTDELTGLANRKAYAYGGDSYPNIWPSYSPPPPPQIHLPHLDDTCLLARLLKQNYPHYQGNMSSHEKVVIKVVGSHTFIFIKGMKQISLFFSFLLLREAHILIDKIFF